MCKSYNIILSVIIKTVLVVEHEWHNLFFELSSNSKVSVEKSNFASFFFQKSLPKMREWFKLCKTCTRWLNDLFWMDMQSCIIPKIRTFRPLTTMMVLHDAGLSWPRVKPVLSRNCLLKTEISAPVSTKAFVLYYPHIPKLSLSRFVCIANTCVSLCPPLVELKASMNPYL